MKMTPGIRKLALMVHVIASVGLLGTIAGFLALAVVGLTEEGAHTVSAVYIAMNVLTLSVIVPLSFAALITGIVQSLGTLWGLFLHYWVVFKLLLTLAATGILMLQLPLISAVADLAAKGPLPADGLWEARLSFVLHAGGGLFVLLLAMILSVYKPRGRTRYGTSQRALSTQPEHFYITPRNIPLCSKANFPDVAGHSGRPAFRSLRAQCRMF